MSQMLKCPNPSCPYIFDPSQVPVGVVLSCPRCGMQFTLGAPPAGQAPPPTAPPGYPPTPPAEPVNPELEEIGRTAVEEREPAELLPTRGTNKAQVFILAGIAAVLMAGSALTIIFMILRRDEGTTADTVERFSDYNLALEQVPAGWTRDDDMRVKVGSPHVRLYHHDNPEAYVAFGVWQPKEKYRSPRPSEMKRQLLAPFPRLFDVSTLERDAPAASDWLGESISSKAPYPNGFNFRIQSTDPLNWKGEAYTVAHKGIAYFWMAWCGENDYAGFKDEFAAFRGKFKLLNLRSDWTEKASNVNHFKGDKVPYTISDADPDPNRSWKEVPAEEFAALKEAEPDLDKRLRILWTPEDDRKAVPESAELSVYILGGGSGDATQIARKFAEDQETARIKESVPDVAPTFKDVTAEPFVGDSLPNSVPASAPVVRLISNVKDHSNADRLIVTSGIKVGNKTVVVLCWCEKLKREVFEAKFAQIASSLR